MKELEDSQAKSSAFGKVVTNGLRAYLLLLVVWMILRQFVGDQWWVMFLVNSAGPYLFMPALVTLPLALARGKRGLWMGTAAALAAGFISYGGLLWPKADVEASQDVLRVATYNLSSDNDSPSSVMSVIRALGADVIALQEVESRLTEALSIELADEYPYQILEPGPNDTGLGIVSRLPMEFVGNLPGRGWLGSPQIVEIGYGGATFTFVNLHTVSTDRYRPRSLRRTVDARQNAIETLIEFAENKPDPLIVAGDFNVTDGHRAYSDVSSVLTDAWREAGWGLGNTFPSSLPPGAETIRIFGRPILQWWVRIDYVFHSEHWVAVDAQVGRWDGASDHRPVIVTLVHGSS